MIDLVEVHERQSAFFYFDQVVEYFGELGPASRSEPHCLVPIAVGVETQGRSHRAVNHADGVWKLSFSIDANLVTLTGHQGCRGHVALVVGGDYGRALEPRGVKRACAVREMMRNLNELAFVGEARLDQQSRFESLLEVVEALNEVRRKVFD